MSKAAAAFRTISEVAEELDVPKHVLRFWELKFPQLKPMKRGGGRRYYRPEDLDLLRGIRHLLHSDGYTIKGVQKILREQGVDAAKSAVFSGKNSKQAITESVHPKSGNKGTRRIKGELGSAKSSAGRSSSRSKTKAASTQPLHPVMSAKTIKAVERAIAELKACRDILRPDTIAFKASSSVPAKPRRSRAAR